MNSPGRRNLFTNSTLYVIGNFFVRGSSYVLIPFYIHIFSPADYGVLGVLAAVSNLTSMVLMFGIYAGAARLYFEYDLEERKNLFCLLWLFVVLFPLIILIPLEWIGPIIGNAWLGQVRYDPFVRVTLWSAYLSNYALIPTTLLRNQSQAWKVLGFSVLTSGLTVGSALLLVVVFNLKIEGVIWASFFSNLLMALLYSTVMVKEIKITRNINLLINALKYSLPFWPHSLAGWFLNLSDRILLGQFVPLTQVGVYSFGYQMNQAVGVVIESGNQSWSPFFFGSQSEKSQSLLVPRMATYFVFIATTLCLLLTLLARPVLRLFTPSAYWSADIIVGVLAIGSLTLAPYYIWANTVMYSKKVAGVSLMTIIAGGVNVTLNITLIPKLGMLAAAISTTVGYVLLASMNFIWSERIYPIQHEYIRWVQVIGLALFVGAIGQLVYIENIWLESFYRLALAGGWGIWMGMVFFLDKTKSNILFG